MNILFCVFLSFCISFFIVGNVYAEEDDVLKVKLIEDPSSPIPTILAVLGTIGTLAGLTYAVYRGTEESKLSRATRERGTKLKLAEMLSDFEKDLKKILDEEVKLQPSQWKEGQTAIDRAYCRRVSSDYLNILDRMAYLRKTNVIDDDLIDYFNWFYGYANAVLLYKETVDHDSRDKWPYVDWWQKLERNTDRIIHYPMDDLPSDMYSLFLAAIGQVVENTDTPNSIDEKKIRKELQEIREETKKISDQIKPKKSKQKTKSKK